MASWNALRSHARRWSRPLNSVQGKMVAVFLLLTYVAMQIIAVGLLNRLEAFSISSYQSTLRNDVQALVQTLPPITGRNPWPALIRNVQRRVQSLPTVNVVLLGTNAQPEWTSGLGPPDYPPRALRAALAGNADCPAPRAGAALVWCLQPIESANQRVIGALAASTSASGAYSTIESVRGILLTWTLVALVVVGALSLLVARSITGPIGALTRHARLLAAGDFSTRVPVQSQDEVGQLAQMFNHLGARLRETLEEIRTEQRRADAILTNMTDGVVAVDGCGRVLLCNPSAAAMLGVEGGSAVGKPAATVLPAALASSLVPAIGEAGGGAAAPGLAAPPGAAGAAQPPRAIAAGGRHLLAQIAPLGDGGAPGGSVIVLQDVTAQERQEAMRKEFVANVSHELRTPVTTIKLYVESLLAWGLADTAAVRAKLEVIQAETDRMAGVIGDLLQLSHLDSQRGVIRALLPTDVAELGRSVASNHRASALRKGIRLTAECGHPCVALVDADRIVQVLNNLVTNAIDFTPSGGWIRIVVGGGGSDRGSGAVEGVVVEVADSGCGMAPEELPRIFDRFYRVDASRSREHGGSGLGLAIAKEIVEAHGGVISAASTPGVGTTIRFTLPAAAGLVAK